MCFGSVFLSFFHPNQADYCHTTATVPNTPWYTGTPKRQTKKKIHSTAGLSSRERDCFECDLSKHLHIICVAQWLRKMNCKWLVSNFSLNGWNWNHAGPCTRSTPSSHQNAVLVTRSCHKTSLDLVCDKKMGTKKNRYISKPLSHPSKGKSALNTVY